MKKVIAAALICAVSSFAAWDKFPVIEHGKGEAEKGKGEAKVGFTQSRQGNEGEGPAFDFFKIRYSPVANFELMSTLGYTLGLRYQLVYFLSAGVDVGFPIPNTAWSFTPNVQFSTFLTDALSLGSNVQVTINTEDANKRTDGMDLSAGVELDLAVGQSTLWLSCDLNKGLTRSKEDGEKISRKGEGRGLETVPALGYVASVGNLSLGTSVSLAFGKDAGHDNFKTSVGLDASVKF